MLVAVKLERLVVAAIFANEGNRAQALTVPAWTRRSLSGAAASGLPVTRGLAAKLMRARDVTSYDPRSHRSRTRHVGNETQQQNSRNPNPKPKKTGKPKIAAKTLPAHLRELATRDKTQRQRTGSRRGCSRLIDSNRACPPASALSAPPPGVAAMSATLSDTMVTDGSFFNNTVSQADSPSKEQGQFYHSIVRCPPSPPQHPVHSETNERFDERVTALAPPCPQHPGRYDPLADITKAGDKTLGVKQKRAGATFGKPLGTLRPEPTSFTLKHSGEPTLPPRAYQTKAPLHKPVFNWVARPAPHYPCGAHVCTWES